MNENSDGSSTGLWHYALGSERKGPVTEATLSKLLATGELSSETYVWRAGMEGWVHMGTVDELRSLVAGVGADVVVEAFVEEDTMFTPSADIVAAHGAMSVKGIDDGPSEDTIVESVDGFLASQAASRAASGVAESLSGVQALHDTGVEALSAVADVEMFEQVASSAGGAEASASGADVFGSSEPEPDDIFSSGGLDDDVFDTGDDIHGRRQSSVLFSLDELGRDESSSVAAPDPFVTDSSGLIDIKAIADSQSSRAQAPDPFAGAGAGLVIPPRASVGTVAVPIVDRRRGLGPWILAAAALLLIGGGALAFIVMGGKDGKPDPAPTVVAVADPQTQQPGAASVGDKPGESPADQGEPTRGAAAAVGADVQDTAQGDTGEAAAVAHADTNSDSGAAISGDAQVAAAVVDTASADAAGSADTAAAASGTQVAKAGTPDKAVAEATSAGDKAEAARKARKARKAREAREARLAAAAAADVKPPTEVVKTTTPKATPRNTGTSKNTGKVNALLGKLNGSDGASTGGAAAVDKSLPKKLSAASVRNTVKKAKRKFGKCGGMAASAGGSVTVTTKFVIESSGAVKSARIVNAGGTSADVQRCVVGALKSTRFSKFQDPSMTVNYPIVLR